jgi:hypothetical protein
MARLALWSRPPLGSALHFVVFPSGPLGTQGGELGTRKLKINVRFVFLFFSLFLSYNFSSIAANTHYFEKNGTPLPVHTLLFWVDHCTIPYLFTLDILALQLSIVPS